MLKDSRDILIGFLLLCAVSWWVMGERHLRAIDQGIYDSQVRWLRTNAPVRLTEDVVVIGFDEATHQSIPEPAVLWHRHVGTLLTGLSMAQPTVVGLAISGSLVIVD
jgi:hypothetical protein